METRGRKKLPVRQKKKLLQVMIRAKYIKKAAAEIDLIVKKYNDDGIGSTNKGDS